MNVKEQINLGKDYFDHKEYHKAEQCLREVVAEHENFADVHNLLGVINHIGGRFQAAIDYFQKALRVNPNYTEAILNLAVLYNDLGQYADAKKLYTKLKKSKGKNSTSIEPVLKGKLSNLHAEIGDIYRSISMFDFAIDEYRKALNLNAKYHDIRTKLGQALRENGKPKDSIKELEAVIKANPKNNPARVQLGLTLYTTGKTAEAKKTWQKALENNPRDQYAKMYLRLCSATDKASKPATKAKKSAPEKARKSAKK